MTTCLPYLTADLITLACCVYGIKLVMNSESQRKRPPTPNTTKCKFTANLMTISCFCICASRPASSDASTETGMIRSRPLANSIPASIRRAPIQYVTVSEAKMRQVGMIGFLFLFVFFFFLANSCRRRHGWHTSLVADILADSNDVFFTLPQVFQAWASYISRAEQ